MITVGPIQRIILKRANVPLRKYIIDTVNKISETRNEIEHHFTEKPKETLKNSILEAYLVINSIRDDLFSSIALENIYGADNFSKLKAAEKEHDEIKAPFLQSWKSMGVERPINCAECKSDLTQPTRVESEINIECKNCANKFTKTTLIDAFCDSNSFRETHAAIRVLQNLIKLFTQNEKNKMLDAAQKNMQIKWIEDDLDVQAYINQLRNT